jgi:hypothetical protein
MTIDFNTFIQSIILESLHPELQEIVKSSNKRVSKQAQIAKKIKDLTNRGEKTGIEGNMPKGSSRAYLHHDTPENIVLDGKPTKIKTGTKVAIRASLDAHHDRKKYDGLSLGAMQNKAEAGDSYANDSHRILTKDSKTGHYHTNTDGGIFPPLIDHDHENHEWSHVGHARDIKKSEFNKLTKCESHPNGISHENFCKAMNRFHERNNGKYWNRDHEHERNIDHVDTHPLVQKFQEYHGNTGHPTYDLQQIKNMGVFEHPDGSKHIVARDHGYDTDVASAYTNAMKIKYNGK